jgi:hypothetical protein
MEEEGEQERPAEESSGWKRPELESMGRHYGGADVYQRRRLIAIGGAILIILLLFLLIGGC